MIPESVSYVWDVPGKAVKVELGFDVIDTVAAEAGRGMKEAPPGGTEVGGLMLGRIVPGEPRLVVVKAVEPVPSEYAYGPVYVLSGKDDQRFSAAVSRPREDGLTPVGFFRTHTRGDISLTEQDLWLFATHFSAPHQVALIVKPRETAPPLAGFFFWENGTLKSDATYKEFTLDRRELGGVPREPAQQDPPAINEPALFGAVAAPSNARRVRIPGLRNPTVLAAAAAILLLGGSLIGFVAGLLWHGAPPPPSTRDPYALALSVADREDNLQLTWNRRSPAVARAKRAVLTITDAGSTRTVDISRELLRRGSVVVYPRTSPKGTLRLEVFVSDRDSVSEVWTPPAR